ncbi:hypothetical protein AB1Y20_019826 [Prymnesium parvum]|uniref:Uncharacterized protein n=1 Tax=Prymnesium parvum TaxID=97485 RepID=A0AB34JW94_PRYPA
MEATWAGTVAATAGKVHPAATKEAGMVVVGHKVADAWVGSVAAVRMGVVAMVVGNMVVGLVEAAGVVGVAREGGDVRERRPPSEAAEDEGAEEGSTRTSLSGSFKSRVRSVCQLLEQKTERAKETWEEVKQDIEQKHYKELIGRVRRESAHRTEQAVEKTREVGKAVREAVRQERRLSGGLYIALLATIGFAALREAEWQVRYHRYARFNEFADWTRQMCMDAPWRSETILCQSAQGNWMARQLIRMKLAEREVDNCQRQETEEVHRGWRMSKKPSKKKTALSNGCRHSPCSSRGLSSVLFWLSRDAKSPINKLTFLIGPVKKKLRAIFEDLGRGDLPLSALNARLKTFPDWLLDWALPTFLWPQLRTWGVIIADAPMPAMEECPCDDFSACNCRFPFDMPLCKVPQLASKPPTAKRTRKQRKEARRQEKARLKAARETRVREFGDAVEPDPREVAGELISDTFYEFGSWATDWIDWLLAVELQPISALERFRVKAEDLYAQQCGGLDSGLCAMHTVGTHTVDVKDEL